MITKLLNANTSKSANFGLQDQQRTARILRILTLWLLALGSPASRLATPDFMEEQEATSAKGHDLLRTSPKVTPVEEYFPFQAQGGESVRFFFQQGQWLA